MEETFKSRLDRVFGSLSSSIDANPFQGSSVWCVTDAEIDRKEWNRDKGDEPEPLGRSNETKSDGVEELLPEEEDDLEELDDQDFESSELSSQSSKPDDCNGEKWKIESCIGRDCALDREEEEAGGEKPEDRLYMKDVTDYEIEIDSGNQLPSSFSDADRDPRANHVAATLRLKEDAEAAGKIHSLPATEGNAYSCVNLPENEVNLKSILKRKDGRTDSNTPKRVRFDPECIEKAPVNSEDIHIEIEEAEVTRESTAPAREFTSAVPDYIRNPSRYTHYTFHSSGGMDEQSNDKPIWNSSTMKNPKGIEDEAPAELPKSVMFISRKKRNEALETGNGCNDLQGKEEVTRQAPGGHKRPLQISIAADDQDGDAYDMDENGREPTETESIRVGLKRGCHYRQRATAEEE